MGTVANVALINPPPISGVFHHHPYLPMGLAYLAAVLEEKGSQVTVLDCLAEGIDQNQLKQKLATINPDVIGINSMTPMTPSTLMAARGAKEACPSAAVVLGGPHATFMDKELLTVEPAVDVIVRGEGEVTFAELTKRIVNNVGLNTADGITYRHQNRIVQNQSRDYIQNLDDLPFPAYKHFPLEKYRLFGKLFFPVITSRGCPFQCNFCTTSRILGKQYRVRSPQNIGHELELLKREYGADSFTFYDDTLTLDKKRLYDICDEIKSRKLNIPWDCQTRADKVSEEMFTKMKNTNCQQVFFGIESGCQHVLDAVNKRTTVEQNESAIKMAKKSGLFVAISIILGYPGETAEMRKETFNFIRRVEPDDVYLCIATPYPGTELRKEVEQLGYKMSSDWSQYDTTTPVFENPLLSGEEALRLRKEFYNRFYSPKYVMRHMFKRNFYSRVMSRVAANHIVWRIKGR
ncbi:MAG: B12-binding domain-containing radical SAM protein [Candidatus Bathyarchaeota archaeon]|nr:B12-binding domain-containing radical SAM protein [Candidatus Termiticorpusculum sp.]